MFHVVLFSLLYTFATLGATSDPAQGTSVPSPIVDQVEDHRLVAKSGEEEPRVFFFVPSVWTFITDPNSSAFFLLLVTFQVIRINQSG